MMSPRTLVAVHAAGGASAPLRGRCTPPRVDLPASARERGAAMPGKPLLALLAAGALALIPGRARGAESTASWAVGHLEVVHEGTTRRLPEGTFVDGYTLKASARAREGAPIGDAVLVVRLSAFSPARDLPRQPRGLYHVKGTFRLVAQGSTRAGEGIRHSPDLLEGRVTAALPLDPTAGGGGFTLRAQILPGSHRAIHAAEGTLTVNERREAELTLVVR